MFRNFKVMFFALIVLALAGGTFAFAAANTVADPGNAGYKASTVSGYTITNVVYDLNSDPTKLDKITFNIAPTADSQAPVSVYINVATSPAFGASQCVVTHPSAYLATCTFGSLVDVTWTAAPIAIDTVNKLDIVVSSSANPS